MNESTSLLEHSFEVNESLVSVLECPNITSEDEQTLRLAKYWVGGVSVCVVSFIGIVLNLTAVCVLLSTLSNRNNFNQLTALLFLIDSIYLTLSVLTTLQIRLNLTSYNLTLIFPKFTYPVWSISLTLSIFITVGIAHERYIAIKYPIIHRQRMRSAKYRRINLLKYIVGVFISTMIFNIPKFFVAIFKLKITVPAFKWATDCRDLFHLHEVSKTTRIFVFQLIAKKMPEIV